MLSAHCSARGLIPAATAISGDSVASSSADQRHARSAMTAPAPSQMVARSVPVTARMSPNR